MMGRANVVKNFKSPVIIEQTRQLIKYLKNNGGISESTKVFEILNESDHFHDICAMLMGANVLEEIHENDKTFFKLKCHTPKSTVEVQTGHERVCGIIEMNKKDKQRKIHCRHCKKQYPLHNWHVFTAHFHQEHMDHLQVYHMNHMINRTKVCQNVMPISGKQVNNNFSSTIDAITTNCTRMITETNNTASLSTNDLRPGTQHDALKRSPVMSENIGPELKRLRNAVPAIEGTVTKQSKRLLTQFPITVTEFLKIQKDHLQSSESANQLVGNELETLMTTNSEQQIHLTLDKSPQLAAKTVTSNGLKPTPLPAQLLVTVTKSPSESNGKGPNGHDCNMIKLHTESCKPNTIVHLNTRSANFVEQNPYNCNDIQEVLVENDVDSAEAILPDTSNAPDDYDLIIPRFSVSETQEKDAAIDDATDAMNTRNDILRKQVEPAKPNIFYITQRQCSKPSPILKSPLQFIHVKPKTIATTAANINTLNTLIPNHTNSKLGTMHIMPQRKYANIQPKPTPSDNYENERPIKTSTINRSAVKSKEPRSTASVMPNLPITSKQIKYATPKSPGASLNVNILSVNTQGVKRVAPAFFSTSDNSRIKCNAKSVYESLKEHQSATSKEPPRIPSPKTRSEIFYTQRIKEGTPLYVNLKEPKSPNDDFRNISPLNETQTADSDPMKSTEQCFYIDLEGPELSSDAESGSSLDESLITSQEKTNVLKSKEPQRITSICKIPSGITIKRVPAKSVDRGTKNNSFTSNGSNASVSKSQIIENTEILPIKIVNVHSVNNNIYKSSAINDDPHFEFVSSGGINSRNKNESSFMRFEYSDDEYVNDEDAENNNVKNDNYNNDKDYDSNNNDNDDYNNDDGVYNNCGDGNNNDDNRNSDDVSNMRFEYSDDNDDGYIIEL